MIKAFILSQLRHAATALGASMVTYLVSQGASPTDANVLAGDLLVLISIGSSIWDKYHVATTMVKKPLND